MRKDRLLEFVNEFITLCCVYHYYLFSDFVADPETRYTIGNSLIGFTVTCLVVNLLVMVYGTVEKLIYLYKFYKSKWRKLIHKDKLAKKLTDLRAK